MAARISISRVWCEELISDSCFCTFSKGGPSGRLVACCVSDGPNGGMEGGKGPKGRLDLDPDARKLLYELFGFLVVEKG